MSTRATFPNSRPRLHALRTRVRAKVQTARKGWAARLDPTVSADRTNDPHPLGSAVSLDGSASGVVRPTLLGEDATWVRAHRDFPVPEDLPENTAVLFADAEVQAWMAQTLTALGWVAEAPIMVTEGWVPARGENLDTGQPAVTFTTPSKTSAHARRNDPATSKSAGAAAAANHSITVNSHQGRLLLAYHAQHLANPGVGLTAAAAVNAADLLTDGATGSPWRRVTELRDLNLLSVLLDETATRVTRKNESNSDGGVLVITPLGLRAAQALIALREHGYPDYPLTFDHPAEEALFEDHAQTLARINALPNPEAPEHEASEHEASEQGASEASPGS